MSRRSGAGLALALLLLAGVPGAPAGRAAPLAPPGPAGVRVRPPPAAWPEPPPVTAASYLLMDATTGQVLASRRADQPRPVASTVKILTALTVLHRTAPEEMVTVGEEVRGVGGASVGLRPGDTWPVRRLQAAMVVRSGNDAAVALAVHVAGSVPAFVSLMRRDAVSLGLAPERLSSPTGLGDRNLLSAADLAVVTRTALAHPSFRDTAGLTGLELPGRGRVPSRNRLLSTYRGATGVKTGHTDAAGWCLVASARRGGRQLLAVVLDSRSDEARFADAARLLDHGFSAFRRVGVGPLRLRRAGEWIPLSGSAPGLLVPRAGPPATTAASLPAALPDGEVTAEVTIRWDGAELGTIDLTGRARRGGTAGAPVLGRWLADRAYAGLRAVATGGPTRPAAEGG